MNDMLTVTGKDAITLGAACNRQPELLADNQWRTASGLPEATRCLALDPQGVRLTAPTRVLVEDVLKAALPPEADLNAAIEAARGNTQSPINDGQRLALDIIHREINR